MDACKHLHALAFLYPIDAPDLSPPSQDEKAALENLPLEAGQVAKADAFLKRRGDVTPEDVKAMGHDVLRHRSLRTYEAEAEEITGEALVRRIFEAVEVP